MSGRQDVEICLFVCLTSSQLLKSSFQTRDWEGSGNLMFGEQDWEGYCHLRLGTGLGGLWSPHVRQVSTLYAPITPSYISPSLCQVAPTCIEVLGQVSTSTKHETPVCFAL